MSVRLTQIDGKLPNMVLMRLAAWHKHKGDDIHFTRSVEPGLFDPDCHTIYGSSIFKFTAAKVERFKLNFPDAVIGGTGTSSLATVEDIVPSEFDGLDYSPYPDFAASIGFTQRGCRLKCKFCVVPKKEGKNRSVKTIDDIWRGEGHPKHLHLLDNDFFGQEHWRERIAEIRDGDFKVCFNQGINVRLFDEEAAEALASVEYRDDQFKTRRIYTAWDNIGDEQRFFRGIDMLEAAGVPAKHVMAYMLIGYDRRETWDRIMHRFDRMVERGVMPYPMVFDQSRKDLKQFQRWVVTGLYRAVPWDDYVPNATAKSLRANEDQEAML
jgi:hypothetical protein